MMKPHFGEPTTKLVFFTSLTKLLLSFVKLYVLIFRKQIKRSQLVEEK